MYYTRLNIYYLRLLELHLVEGDVYTTTHSKQVPTQIPGEFFTEQFLLRSLGNSLQNSSYSDSWGIHYRTVHLRPDLFKIDYSILYWELQLGNIIKGSFYSI